MMEIFEEVARTPRRSRARHHRRRRRVLLGRRPHRGRRRRRDRRCRRIAGVDALRRWRGAATARALDSDRCGGQRRRRGRGLQPRARLRPDRCLRPRPFQRDLHEAGIGPRLRRIVVVAAVGRPASRQGARVPCRDHRRARSRTDRTRESRRAPRRSRQGSRRTRGTDSRRCHRCSSRS